MSLNASPPSSTNAPLTPPSNGSWNNPQWFVDRVNGSDRNPGTRALPVKRYSSIVERWGTVSPVLRQTTQLVYLSSETDNSDPVIWTPVHANGATSSIEGDTPPVVAAIVLAGTVAFSSVAGANALLASNLGSVATGLIVQNTTAGKASRTPVYKLSSGTTYVLAQPAALSAVGGSMSPALVSTWADGDTANLLRPIAVNIVRYDPTLADQAATFANQGWIYQLDLYQPTGLGGGDYAQIGQWVRMLECVSHRRLAFIGAASLTGSAFSGAALTNVGCFGKVIGGDGCPPSLYGGFVSGPASQLGAVALDGGFIVGQTLSLFRSLSSINGPIWLDGTIISQGNIQHQAGVIAGAAGKTINMQGVARFANLTGQTFTAMYTAPGLVTGVLLNGAATGNSFAGGVINPGIATTPANLDAAAGVAGFGGLAFNLGGASIAKAA